MAPLRHVVSGPDGSDPLSPGEGGPGEEEHFNKLVRYHEHGDECDKVTLKELFCSKVLLNFLFKRNCKIISVGSFMLFVNITP